MKFKDPKTAELDLTDQATLAKVMNADISKQKPSSNSEAKATEQAIKNLKPVKVTIELAPSEHSVITRQAEIMGVTVKEFLHSQLKTLLIDKSIGKALVSGPSRLSGGACRKVSGPTGQVRRVDNHAN